MAVRDTFLGSQEPRRSLYIETEYGEFVPGGASLTVGNKTVEVGRDGTLRIDAAKGDVR